MGVGFILWLRRKESPYMNQSEPKPEPRYFTLEETLVGLMEIQSPHIEESLSEIPEEARTRLIEAMAWLTEEQIKAAEPLNLPPSFQLDDGHRDIALRLKAVLSMQEDVPENLKWLSDNAMSLFTKGSYLLASGMLKGIVDPGGDQTISRVYSNPTDFDHRRVFQGLTPQFGR